MTAVFTDPSIQHEVMLADLYVVAFKVDMDLADRVWELWNAGIITNAEAERFWSRLAALRTETRH